MTKRLVIAAACAAALLLSGCAAAAPTGQGAVSEAQQADATELIAGLGLSESDPKALVDGLEALPVADRPAGLTVAVTPTAVVLQPKTADERSLSLSGGEFYMSVAPYVDQTHPCDFHVPTGCIGELGDEPIELTIEDAATGEIVLEKSVATANNGFAGVWLPRDRELRVRVTSAKGSGEQIVNTGDTDPTCITTLQLSDA